MGWSFFGGKQPTRQGKIEHRRKSKVKGRRGRRPLFEELEARHLLAVFTVTNLTDAAVAPAGSLRAAIEAANAPANPGPDVILFAPRRHGHDQPRGRRG